jgi:electron transport complex protein RnfE
MFVLTLSNIAVSLVRHFVSDAIRLPAFVMIIASFTACIELLMRAYAFELYQILGIFIPLIVTNCSILGRADAFACKNSVLPAAYDGFIMGLGFGLVLVLIGGLREIIGNATLFDNMQLLFGEGASQWKIILSDDYPGFLAAILPPGAFIVVGFVIAGKNVIDATLKRRADAKKDKPVRGANRARVTGHIS